MFTVRIALPLGRTTPVQRPAEPRAQQAAASRRGCGIQVLQQGARLRPQRTCPWQELWAADTSSNCRSSSNTPLDDNSCQVEGVC